MPIKRIPSSITPTINGRVPKKPVRPYIGTFGKPMLEGILVKRYKRFLADVRIPEIGKTFTVHCPNTGSMLGMKLPGCPALVSDSENPSRKLRYTLECIQSGKTWVCVNTLQANRLVDQLISRGLISKLKNFEVIKKEPRMNKNSRMDLLLQLKNEQKRKMALEVKSVTLVLKTGLAQFPDAITLRGQKHLTLLTRLARDGMSAGLVFLVMRSDCKHFYPADCIDPRYGELLREAVSAGVHIFLPAVHINRRGFYFQGELPQIEWAGLRHKERC